MKRILNLLLVSCILIAVSSCQEEDPVIYNGNQTLVQFAESTYNFGLPVATSGTIEVQVSASTTSSSDRTFQINLVADETEASQNLSYDFDTSVTIPAGEYFGTFEVSATDNGINDERSLIVLEIGDSDNSDDVVLEDNVTTVSVFQTCPVPDDRYSGTWDVTTSGCTGDGNGGCGSSYSGIESTVEIEPLHEDEDDENSPIIGFRISDITGGLYPVGYGDAPNPANVTENCNILDVDDQPDVVYQNDVFNGDGSIEVDPNTGELIGFTINWSNGYGDSGTSVYTPAE